MFVIEAARAIRATGLPAASDSWVARCRDAGLSVTQVVELHAHAIEGGRSLDAPHHAKFARRMLGEFELLQCACGSAAMAASFSSVEECGWWEGHLSAVGAGMSLSLT